MSPRLRRLAGSAILAVLGLVLLGSGLARERVRCERAAATCTITSSVLFEETDVIPLAQISDHRFERTDSRAGRRGATILLDRSGRQLRIAVDAEAAARARHDALHAFFIGDAAAVEVTTGPSWWLVALGALALATAPWFLRRGPVGRAFAPAADAPTPGARAPVIALVVGGLVLAGMAASTFYTRTRGSLELICHQRCEIDGGTCMPGNELLLTLPPGEHEVRFDNPDAPTVPIVRRVEVVRGQVTRFECAL